jgi:hypothetical protein
LQPEKGDSWEAGRSAQRTRRIRERREVLEYVTRRRFPEHDTPPESRLLFFAVTVARRLDPSTFIYSLVPDVS